MDLTDAAENLPIHSRLTSHPQEASEKIGNNAQGNWELNNYLTDKSFRFESLQMSPAFQKQGNAAEFLAGHG